MSYRIWNRNLPFCLFSSNWLLALRALLKSLVTSSHYCLRFQIRNTRGKRRLRNDENDSYFSSRSPHPAFKVGFILTKGASPSFHWSRFTQSSFSWNILLRF